MYQKANKTNEKKVDALNEKPKKVTKEEKKSKKLEKLIGDLKDDEEFKEFLAANKAIKSTDAIWKNDVNLDIDQDQTKSKKKEQKKMDEHESSGDEDDYDENLILEDTQEEDETCLKENKSEIQKLDENKAKEKASNEKTNETKTNKADDEEADFENGRLFVRNLCYTSKEEDLEKLFEPYAPLVEVSMPLDGFSKKPKGFAYVTCMFPEKAIKAFNELDGTIFQVK